MSDRWTGTWLSGPGSAQGRDDGPQRWPGERLGLPEQGPGAVAARGARLGAFLADLVIAALVTSLFVQMDVQRPEVMQTFNYWAILVWFGISVVAVSLFGFTPGKLLFGLRVVRVDGATMVGPLRAIPRTLLTAVIIPAAMADRDGRGLHDRAVGTVVVRIR
ncbi:RDD family protein [Actinophytocola xinjiangensis]|uniref:RDD family protein n=1 Tax=Actinophytocola xinjiangensis TaxID=485602 RepID=UPI001FE86E9B|nr:RDD family protein [Actinophytocola xinjiangensis]